MEISDWWEKHLAEYAKSGVEDARKGVYAPPHADDDDPQNQDEVAAYWRAWGEERTKLGDKFRWSHGNR